MFDLYGGADPGTLKLTLCLKELGLDYAFHPLDLAKLGQWSPAHRKLAPQGQFPVLIEDGRVMIDATIALLYLAESNPTPKLLPSNLVDRYDAQARNDVFDAAFLNSVNLIGWYSQTSPEQRQAYNEALAEVPNRQGVAGWSAVWKDAEADQLKRAEEKLSGGVAKLESLLVDREWLVGSSYTITDINVFALVEGISLLRPPLLNSKIAPHSCAWLERMRTRPAVRAALEAPERAKGLTVYAPPP